MKALTTFSALALMAVASPAYAQSWTGCYVGAEAGLSASNTKLDATETYSTPEDAEYASKIADGTYSLASLDGLGANGGVFGGIVGCDYQINRFVVGVWGDYLDHNQSIEASAYDGYYNAKIDLENQWSIGGRLGVIVNESTLLYALAAYTEGSTSDLKFSAGEYSDALKLKDQKGYTLGAGLETHLVGNFFLSGEYRFTRFDENTYNVDSCCGDYKYYSEDISSETDVHTGLLAIKYRLGPQASPISPLK